MVIPSLVEEGFRVVQAAAGDSINVFLDGEGSLRACGCFRVSEQNSLLRPVRLLSHCLGIRRTFRFPSLVCHREIETQSEL